MTGDRCTGPKNVGKGIAKKCRKMSKVVAAIVWRSHFFFVILHVESKSTDIKAIKQLNIS